MELKHPVMPMDPAILRILPDEGSMLGKYHPMGRRTRDIVKDLDDEFTTSSKVQVRLRLMKENGLVIDVRGSGDRIWQRTAKGAALLAEMGEEG